MGALRYRRASNIPLKRQTVPVSVLRPMCGADDNTEACLRTVFAQDYPAFEVLLSVQEESDAAVPVARKVMAEFPHIPSRLLVVGVSPLPNAKVWSLRTLVPAAANEIIMMTDSDIGLERDCLAITVAEMAREGVALITCPYRAVPGWSFWSRSEAMGLNTEFLAGMLTARMLNGMDYAIGCTIVTRKADLESIGGLLLLQRYLAEDFVMGNLLHKAKREVVLSRSVIEHHIGGNEFLRNWKHRLRWARSTRRSRGWAYVGELFTKTTAIALLLILMNPQAWGIAVVALCFRAAAAFFTGIWILNDPLLEKYWFLLPLEDISSFVTWSLGFFGKTITWRGRELVLAADGTLQAAQAQGPHPEG